MKKIALYLILLCCSFRLYAQDIPVEISDPIDISNFGWNKVLQMKNGNTLLFHFEIRKGFIVKVFDKNRKEIASQKHITKLLDLNRINVARFDGLVEIGGEAVLFTTTEILGRKTLLRLRFDGSTGKLIAEEKMAEAPTFARKSLSILKSPGEDGYYMPVITAMEHPEDGVTIELVAMNSKHEELKRIKAPVYLKPKGYGWIDLAEINMEESGDIAIVCELGKDRSAVDKMEHEYMLLYLSSGADAFTIKEVGLPADYQPEYCLYTHNVFDRKFNFMFRQPNLAVFKDGANSVKFKFDNYTFLVVDEGFSQANMVDLNDSLANEYLQKNTDSSWKFVGDAEYIFTNHRGITAVVMEDKKIFYRGNDMKDIVGGDLSLVMYDDKMMPIWNTNLIRRPVFRGILKEIGPEVFSRTAEDGLAVTRYLNTKNNLYIIYNDANYNFDRTFKKRPTPINDYYQTNAVYYCLNKKKEVTKAYLLGKPEDGVFRHTCNNSSMLDESTAMYATVFEQRKGKDLSMHIAWCKLED